MGVAISSLGVLGTLLSVVFKRPDVSDFDPRFSTLTLLLAPEKMVRGRASRIVQILGRMSLVLLSGVILTAIIRGLWK
jgi:hypothetical protein